MRTWHVYAARLDEMVRGTGPQPVAWVDRYLDFDGLRPEPALDPRGLTCPLAVVPAPASELGLRPSRRPTLPLEALGLPATQRKHQADSPPLLHRCCG